MSMITVSKNEYQDGSPRASEFAAELERGQILFFDRLPFELSDDDLRYLLSARQENTRLHKNISYRPGSNVIRGFGAGKDRDRMLEVMTWFSATAAAFVSGFLRPYASGMVLDYASFRPIEEAGRDLPLHKRNELLHVDAFPSRPTHGGRILRFFFNINPTEARIWEVGESFETIARNQAGVAGLAKMSDSIVARALSTLGLIPDRSAYDRFMLRFHDHLKENAEYQSSSPKHRLDFPPNSAWMVYTDCVPHSVLSGRFALEQTFIIPFTALVAPESSPLRILERLAGRSLAAAK